MEIMHNDLDYANMTAQGETVRIPLTCFGRYLTYDVPTDCLHAFFHNGDRMLHRISPEEKAELVRRCRELVDAEKTSS